MKPAGRVRIRNMAVYSAGSKEKSPRTTWGPRLPIEFQPQRLERSEYLQRQAPRQAPPGCEARSPRGLR